MKIKAGKYTLALTMIISGVLMLINTYCGNGIFENLWMYSPVVLILFGLEIIVVNLIYMHRENYKVEVSMGSILLIIIVIAIFMMGTSKIEIYDPLYNNFF